MVVLNVWKNLALASLGIAIVCLVGCTKKPTDQQLEVWRKEAVTRNRQILADNDKNNQQRQWNLVIQGETATGKPVTLNWQQIENLAQANVNTVDANNIVNPNQVFKFRGIAVDTLLQKFGIQPGVTEVTFVCYDAYQVTIKIEDLLTYPIILALTRNNQQIQRSEGGPIYLVFPYTQHQELKQKYDEGMWAFYVTDIIVGTEKALVRVGQREFNLADLDKLPQVTLTQKVGYRVWWPSNKVQLQGVRVRDVLSLAGVNLNPTGSVVISGKPVVYSKTTEAINLTAEEVRDCDILLATRWDNDKKPISSKMGGPVTLAFGDNCQAETKQLKWATFVEELTVKP
ncbi:molybdopterin-dependent oxidoreductase [Anabaena sp. WFMT]|uniref:molybdopterin-dependent oxidoreductase n=1 Tax=Anabaena sp. WFMT TaxID=3449730 RepID=UPI003F20BBEB